MLSARIAPHDVPLLGTTRRGGKAEEATNFETKSHV